MDEPGVEGLDEWIARARVDADAAEALRRSFEACAAIMVVHHHDLLHRCQTDGAVHALSRVRSAQRAMLPAVKEGRGTVTRRGGPTWSCLFASPGDALHAALGAWRALEGFNRGAGRGVHAHRHAVHASIGLGFGPLLAIPGEEPFGAEALRAQLLSTGTSGGGVRATTDFWRALGGPPPGVGGFTAPAAQRDAAGFSFIVVSDHRDPPGGPA